MAERVTGIEPASRAWPPIGRLPFDAVISENSGIPRSFGKVLACRERPRHREPSASVAGILAMMLSACTGSGGGYLPPDTVFNGKASFAFNISCEDKGGLNPPLRGHRAVL